MVHENSHLFDVEDLKACFPEDQFVLQSEIITPENFGWPSRRPRRWTIIVPKRYLVKIGTSLKNVVPLYERVCACTFREYLIAKMSEILSELAWAMQRPNSLANGKAVPSIPTADDFLNALIKAEQETLGGYVKNSPFGCVHNLSQNSEDHGISSTPKVLHTIIKHPAIHWITDPGNEKPPRWFCPTELAVSQGFPVDEKMVNPRATKGYHRQRLVSNFQIARA
eukprot:4031833-Karenia_brevis.AAC.1